MKKINVVGAAIVRDGAILSAQRGPEMSLPGLWEFPGGKVEPGETQEEALVREIQEELGCVIRVDSLVTTTTHPYDFGEVTLTTFLSTLVSGEPVLTEHAEARWIPIAQLDSVEWAPADVPAVREIMAELCS